MKQKKSLKNKIICFVKSLIWPILFGIGQFIIPWLLSFYYISKEHVTLEQVTNSHFQAEFQIFMEQQIDWIVLGNLAFLLLFYFIYQKKNKIEKQFHWKKTLNRCTFCIGLGICLNVCFGWIFHISYEAPSIRMFLFQLLSIGIIGPILEELVFRGLMKKELERAYSENMIFVIVTLIFGFSHQGFQNIIYALIMGSVFFTISRYNSLKDAIVGHIGVNISTLIVGFLTKGWNQSLLIFFVVGFVLLILTMVRKKYLEE